MRILRTQRVNNHTVCSHQRARQKNSFPVTKSLLLSEQAGPGTMVAVPQATAYTTVLSVFYEAVRLHVWRQIRILLIKTLLTVPKDRLLEKAPENSLVSITKTSVSLNSRPVCFYLKGTDETGKIVLFALNTRKLSNKSAILSKQKAYDRRAHTFYTNLTLDFILLFFQSICLNYFY